MIKSIETKEEFAELVNDLREAEGYRDPIMFGIAKVDLGQKDSDKVLQCQYPVVNVNENYATAAIFQYVLEILSKEEGSLRVLHHTENELVIRVNDAFIDLALQTFSVYAEEAVGDAHKNVQVIRMLAAIKEDVKVKLASEGKEYLGIGKYNELMYDLTFIYKDAAVETVQAGYLKLYALSTNKSPLRSLNLDGLFGKLHNVAWMGNQPIELDYLRSKEIELKLTGQYPDIDYVDKFPQFLMHVIPADNTRILDTHKVRMGAKISDGTTLMPGASYVNFNAGTEGPCMVEGRISSSVKVGTGTDIGGGASILGTLSGGNSTPISVGENCLLEVNSVTGIPLGDECIVTAGCEILAGTKVIISHDEWDKILEVNENACDIKTVCMYDKYQEYLVKAKYISGMNGMTIRRNSITGRVEVTRTTRFNTLNPDLH